MRKVTRILARLKIFLGNGQGYFMDFRYPILLAIALKVYLPGASWFLLALFAVAIIVIMIIVGWFDLKYIKIAQKVAEINTSEYNPYFKKLNKKLK